MTVSETVDWDEDDDSGLRPYGGKPYGGKPYGGKPYGGKPYGGKPYGGKPYGGKPYGGKGADGGLVDWDDWEIDIGELVCERSAVIRQGATLFTGDERELSAWRPAPTYRAPGEPSQPAAR